MFSSHEQSISQKNPTSSFKEYNVTTPCQIFTLLSVKGSLTGG